MYINKYINKSFLRYVSYSMFVLMVAGVALVSGCSAKGSTSIEKTSIEKTSIEKTAVQDDGQDKEMADFRTLLGNNSKSDTVITFIDQNISKVSKENASAMVNGLEEMQKKDLPKLEEKYYQGQTIQNKMTKVYKPGFDLNELDGIKDKELKDLLIETRAMGYKIETAEGTYFPVMNYEAYKKYSPSVTEDMKDYINIMAEESNKVPIKDAALMIGWDEIMKRALTQEQFIEKHGNSSKVEDMKQLERRYLTFIFYGANNTPLFSYESKVMVPEAKTVYLNTVKNNGDRSLAQMLGKYMDILSKTGYKESDASQKFRKESVEIK